MKIRAIYRDGVFHPMEPVSLPEGAHVVIHLFEAEGAEEEAVPYAGSVPTVTNSGPTPVGDTEGHEFSADDVIAIMEKRYPGTIGVISHEEAVQMRRDMDEAFGRIDPRGW